MLNVVEFEITLPAVNTTLWLNNIKRKKDRIAFTEFQHYLLTILRENSNNLMFKLNKKCYENLFMG